MTNSDISADYPLKKCLKKYKYDQDKAEFPEVTITKALLSLFERGIKPIIDNATGFHSLKIPTYVCHDGGKTIGGTEKLVTWGKGITHKQAISSSLMEFIERRTANLYFTDKRLSSEKSETLFNSYEKIKEDKSSKEQLSYHKNTSDKSSMDIFFKKKMTYTKVYSLTDKKLKFFPIGWHLYHNGSNGLASGNTLEEAILQGLYEVIERHNTAELIGAFGELLDLELVKENYSLVGELIRKFEEVNIPITIMSLSKHIGIPTFYCFFRDKHLKDIFEYNHGRGSAGTVEKALIRSITEANSVLHQKLYSENMGFPHPKKTFSLYNIQPSTGVSFSRVETYENDISKEIENCLDILGKKGFEVFFKNITSLETNIPTVYVICRRMYTDTMINPSGQSIESINESIRRFYNINFHLI